MSDLVKVTVNLTEENHNTIEKLAKDMGINKTTVINRAIVAEKFIVEAEKRGQKILVEDENGSVRQVVFR